MPTSMRRQTAAGTLALLTGLAAVACSDTPSAPRTALAPTEAPSAHQGPGNHNSYTISQRTVGDTVVTELFVGTNTNTASTFDIGHTSKIDFPYASSSICDPTTSSYGPGTWDQKCSAANVGIQITAKAWLGADGKLVTDFQPALRFVPGLRKMVTLTLRDAAVGSTHVDYCTATGCVNEALTDPSLNTVLDPNNGFVQRPIKHFSGYNVVVDRSDSGDAQP